MRRTAKLKQRLSYGILCLVFLCVPLVAQPAPGRPGGNEPGVDYASARREIQTVERAINDVINATFSSPFALNQKVKGAYLPGYGVSFNFLVNIHRALINTPFGEMRSGPQITPEQKKRRIEELKKKLIRVLLERGESLRQIAPEDAITIVAFFEDRNFPEEANQNKTIVLTVLKKDLGESAAGNEAPGQIERRVKIIEY